MSAVFGFFVSLWGRLIGGAAKLAVSTGLLAILGPLGPVITGIGQLIGGIITAIAEIIASLSKSPEGRVALCILAGAAGFLYLRFHYIEEGRAAGKAEVRPKIVTVQKPCPPQPLDRRKK